MWLTNISGIAIASALIFIPAGYGGTESWSKDVINALAGGGVICWIGALLIRRCRPSVRVGSVVGCAFLLALGWGMALNAKSVHDLEFWEFMPLSQAVYCLPGSVDANASYKMMVRISVLFGVFMASCDLCRQRRWMKALVITMAAVGTATAAFGIYQKISAEPFDIWPVERAPQTAFATFWYHGNAASFLNLTWPLVMGLSIRSFQHGSSHSLRALWLTSLMIVFTGLALNVSKAGHVMAIALLCVYAGTFIRRVPGLVNKHGWRQPLALTVLALVALGAGLAALDWSQSMARWQEFLARTGGDSRLDTAKICVGLARIGGWFGFGPGSFDAVFQHHVADLGLVLGVRWKFAHNDYLQTLVEWGFIGAILWICFWFIPLKAAVWEVAAEVCPTLRRQSRVPQGKSNRRRRNLLSGHPLVVGASLALVGVFVHAAYDFPLQIAGIQLYAVVLAGVVCAASIEREDVHDHDI